MPGRPDLPNLLLDPGSRSELAGRTPGRCARWCGRGGARHPAAGLMASLAYFDGYRSAWPANLIQAQRDYFGSHTYERVDARAVPHRVAGD